MKDDSKNWLYGATIQVSLKGQELAWSSGEWNFIPVGLANVPSLTPDQRKTGQGTDTVPGSNMTLQTSAMRARLDCEPVDQVADTSSWLVDLPGEDLLFDDDSMEALPNGYELARIMFGNSTSSTTVVGDTNVVHCCANGTASDPKRSVIGYWSPTGARPNSRGFPFAKREWPIPFVTKWIIGDSVNVGSSGTSTLYFERPPSLQAARCTPVFDVAEATVSVDKNTGTIHSYELKEAPKVDSGAWSEVFVRHDISQSRQHYNANYSGGLNITTSYGVLFLDAMFGAYDRSPEDSVPGGGFEYLLDNAFNIRDQDVGMNMDLMTYSMYALADKDPEALLNYTTLVSHANRTFQTFFQQFVNSKLSLIDGGWAYQKLDDRSLEGLGRPVDENGTAIAERVYPQTLDANRSIAASVSHRIRVLHMNPVATYLSAAIIIWLIATAACITCLQRRYTSFMLRDVELIAEVLVLVAGSDNLLHLVQERGLALKRDKEVRTMLGWFKRRDGEVRWGVEIVGGPNAVEWVDSPREEAFE